MIAPTIHTAPTQIAVRRKRVNDAFGSAGVVESLVAGMGTSQTHAAAVVTAHASRGTQRFGSRNGRGQHTAQSPPPVIGDGLRAVVRRSGGVGIGSEGVRR